MGITIKPNAVNTIAKGQLLFAEGQPIEYVFALMKGKVLLENKEMRILFGAGSILNLLQVERFNHQVEFEHGVLEEECSAILQNFFKELRKKK